MIRTIQTILLSILVQTISAQTSFNYHEDFKTILVKTKDSTNDLSYEKLLKRFNANDTTLSDFEVLALLIGFTDKPEYKPYDCLETEREIYILNGEGKYQKGLEKANEFLKTHPLNVKTLIEKSYSFYKLGKPDSAQHYFYQGKRIFEAMYFSGLGTTTDTPTFALGPADGQDYIIKFLEGDIGQMGSSRDKHGNFLDVLEAKTEDGQSVTLFFYY